MGTGSDGLVGRCQGARWRWVSRYIMAIWFGLLLITSDGPKNHSLVSWLQATLITIAIIAAIDVWFSRRMGLMIDERGITLHYAFHRKRVPWEEIQGFEWKRWNSPRTEWIWIMRSSAQAIRIPTIQRTPGGEKRSFVYGLLSENLRLKGGAQVDAMATLQHAQATMQSELERSRFSAAAPTTTSTVPPT